MVLTATSLSKHVRYSEHSPTSRAFPPETMDDRLYPDLSAYYNGGFVECGSSIDEPIGKKFRYLLASAPPPSEPDLDLEMKLNITSPEEPDLDYFEGDTIAPDYDLDEDANLNLNTAMEKKHISDKVIDFPQQPTDNDKRDFNAWMTWRKQVNRQLATVILIKRGHQVHLRQSELRRKPLSKHSMESIVQDARGGPRNIGNIDDHSAQKTSLPGRPYIMYGIPRVKLTSVRP